MKIYTIGHSNRKIENFLGILNKFFITHLIDIRTHPYSEYVPDYNRENISKFLKDNNIEYCYKGDTLGGRPPEGFEKYRESNFYKEVLQNLLNEIVSNNLTVALMCSEKDYTKCHRRFVSEDLQTIINENSYDIKLEHIVDERRIDKTLDQFFIVGSK